MLGHRLLWVALGSLVLKIVQESEELAPPKNRVMSDELYVLLGIGSLGINLRESHPSGNNRFNLYVNNTLHRITAFTSDDNVSSNIVTAKQLQSDVGSEKAFQQITGGWQFALHIHNVGRLR